MTVWMAEYQLKVNHESNVVILYPDNAVTQQRTTAQTCVRETDTSRDMIPSSVQSEV